MPFNLLLFPIVGGYYFLVRSNLFRFLHQRIDRQKLLFNSIIAGVFLLIAAFFVSASAIYLFPQLNDVKDYFPVKDNYSGTTVLSFFLGIFLAEIGNKFIDRKRCIRRAIKDIGNEFELLLDSCADQEELIQITLKNDKFYIGWVKTLPLPQHSSYIGIAPAFSGYRDKETKQLNFTSQYLEVYSTYIRNGEATDIRTLTNLVIKMDEVLSANKFDIDMYERFLHVNDEEKPPTQ